VIITKAVKPSSTELATEIIGLLYMTRYCMLYCTHGNILIGTDRSLRAAEGGKGA